jgi:hypothetical protein
MDMWALYDPLQQFGIARNRRRTCQVSVRSLGHFIPVPAHSLFIRHGINLPREPEDLFLFARHQIRDTFEASYPAEPPASAAPNILKVIHCLKCASGKLAEQQRLFDLGGVKSHLLAK